MNHNHLFSNLGRSVVIRLSVTKVENIEMAFKFFLVIGQENTTKSIFQLSVLGEIFRLGVEPALTVLSCPPTEVGWSNIRLFFPEES